MRVQWTRRMHPKVESAFPVWSKSIRMNWPRMTRISRMGSVLRRT